MTTYLVFVVTSVLVGLVAVMLYRRNHRFNPKAFLVGALLNAAALGSILLYQRRRRS